MQSISTGSAQRRGRLLAVRDCFYNRCSLASALKVWLPGRAATFLWGALFERFAPGVQREKPWLADKFFLPVGGMQPAGHGLIVFAFGTAQGRNGKLQEAPK
jgi:hypothetical protein